MSHIDLGERGEEIATEYLLKEGYKILERHYRYSRYEIDIIAKQQHTIVFVEVKTRTSDEFGAPEEFVSKAKEGKIEKAAQHYVEENFVESEARFDIIAILINGDNVNLEHIQDAFFPC